MAYAVMAYAVMPYAVMAYIVMAYVVMACIVMAALGCILPVLPGRVHRVHVVPRRHDHDVR